MAIKKTWNAASIEMVTIASDTPIPKRILHTHTPAEMGLKGRVHIRKKESGKEYRYYYPGILDSLLHVEVPHQLHSYFLPAIHAGKLEKWSLENKLKPYRFKVLPSGRFAHELYESLSAAFYAFIRDAEEDGINSLRWVSSSPLAPDSLISENTPILNKKIVSKMWFLDWTPDRIGTLEFIERHGLDINPTTLVPEDEIPFV